MGVAEAQDIDVQQIMERIRENIRRRRSLDHRPTSEPLASAFDGQGAPDFAHLQSIGDLQKVSLTSHHRLVGPLIIAVKKILLKLLTPILERQAAYNAASTRATADIGTWMQALERRETHALRAATDEAERQLHAAVSDLRAHLSEEFARVKGDLFARVAEEVFTHDSRLRQEALATASDLRQELAAQSRALESAQQASATLRERIAAAERKWRRALHDLQPGRLPETPPEARSPEETPTVAPAELEPEFDYAGFEERFRGSEEDIKGRQRIYVPYFEGARDVLDLGCGRGEFLELLREHGINARGVDLDLDMVLLCRDKKLDVARNDAFAYLGALSDDAVGGIFAAQLIEHLPQRRVIDLVKLCHRKLAPGGALVLETPNPACLMVFADSFYRDLSHVQPIHPDTLKFLFEAAHFHQIELKTLAPVDPSMRVPLLQMHDPALAPFNQGIERLNSLLFGFQDYAVIGRKGGANEPDTVISPELAS
jgi:SAM-dependent methyltransferase/molybdopterin converting factor small subunit